MHVSIEIDTGENSAFKNIIFPRKNFISGISGFLYTYFI